MNINIPEIESLLKEGCKLAAVKLVFDANRDSGIGLDEAKHLVEEIERGNEPTLQNFNRQNVSKARYSISTFNGKTEIRFAKDGVVLQEITPESPLWNDLKEAFPQKKEEFAMLEKQYKQTYNTEALRSKNSLFISKNKNSIPPIVVVSITVIIVLLAIFLL